MRRAGRFQPRRQPRLVTADYHSSVATDNNVSVLLGNGNGTFQFGTTFSRRMARRSRPRAVAVADLIGRQSRPGYHQLYRQHDLGVAWQRRRDFQTAVTYAVGFKPLFMAVGPFNDRPAS